MAEYALAEGFDYYNSGGTTVGGYRQVWNSGGSGDWLTGNSRFGAGQGFCCRLGDATGNTAYIWRKFPGGLIGPDFAVGFAYSQATDGVSQLIYLRNNGVDQLDLRYDGALGFNLYRGTTLLGNTGAVLISNSEAEWVWIDIFGTISDTGHVEVWIDNVKKIDFTGDTNNIAGGGAGLIDEVWLRCPDGSGGSNWANFDDLVVAPTAVRLGEHRIEYKAVNGDVGSGTFVPSTGTAHYALLDESPPSTTDYVTGTTVGNKDTLDVADVTINSSIIRTVQPVILYDKSDAGAREVALRGVSGGSSVSKTLLPSTTLGFDFGETMDVDPATGVAWTYSGLASARLEFEITV